MKEILKKCCVCQLKKSLNQFAKSKYYKLGVVGICMTCKNDTYGSKRITRPCLGMYCRGKLFKSFNGARLCVICRNAIKSIGDYYSEQVYVTGRSKRNS